MSFDRTRHSLLSAIISKARLSKSDSFETAKSLQEKAAGVGFDWPDIAPVFDKLHEEIDELKEEVAKLNSGREGDAVRQNIEKEFGDLLFVCVNLSRFLGLDCAQSLETTNEKFIQRFQYIEKVLYEQGRALEQSSLQELDDLWEEAKKLEA